MLVAATALLAAPVLRLPRRPQRPQSGQPVLQCHPGLHWAAVGPVPEWPPEGDEADDRAANIANASELGVGVERVVTDNDNGYRSGAFRQCWLGPG